MPLAIKAGLGEYGRLARPADHTGIRAACAPSAKTFTDLPLTHERRRADSACASSATFAGLFRRMSGETVPKAARPATPGRLLAW
ncbi:MAG: hypothetical protein IPN05_17680 [Sulfuritalea sp.]|nr:hypothetical protein [Sulfuritalea sp.]